SPSTGAPVTQGDGKKDSPKKDDNKKDDNKKDDNKKDDNKPTEVTPKTPAEWVALARKQQPFTNSADMTFVYLAPGTFLQGSPQAEEGRELGEVAHSVTLTRGFYMATTLVSQKQWKVVMGETPNPSQFRGDDLPVDSVTWHDAQEFCRRLSAKEGLT